MGKLKLLWHHSLEEIRLYAKANSSAMHHYCIAFHILNLKLKTDNYFLAVVLVFELRASTTWAIPPAFLTLVVLQVDLCFCPGLTADCDLMASWVTGPHLTYWLRWGLVNYSPAPHPHSHNPLPPGLTLNYDLPNLYLLSIWYYLLHLDNFPVMFYITEYNTETEFFLCNFKIYNFCG
jgi:hypothetical protein